MPLCYCFTVIAAGVAQFTFGLTRAETASIFWLTHVGITAAVYGLCSLFDPQE